MKKSREMTKLRTGKCVPGVKKKWVRVTLKVQHKRWWLLWKPSFILTIDLSILTVMLYHGCGSSYHFMELRKVYRTPFSVTSHNCMSNYNCLQTQVLCLWKRIQWFSNGCKDKHDILYILVWGNKNDTSK